MKASHIFTEAGMGAAPFKVIGYEERLTGCAFCGRAIKKVCQVISADGKVSSVGCECVKKSGDTGLISAEKVVIKRFKAKQKYEKQMEAYYDVMLEKWGNHPDIDASSKGDKAEYLKEMERVMRDTVNNQDSFG